MFCASILSEVVLGFMLWTGLLGSAQPMAANEADCGCKPCCYAEACPATACPGGACPGCPYPGLPCPAACPAGLPCGMPMVSPWGTGPLKADAHFALTAARPSHLPPCEVHMPLAVDGSMVGGMSYPCSAPGKPGRCEMGARVVKQCANGVVVEMVLHFINGKQTETYKARQKVHFDTPTCVVLSGNHPEPVCANVCIRPGDGPLVGYPVPPPAPSMPCPMMAWSQPVPPQAPIMPVASPFPPLPMPMPQPAQVARLPDPLPLPMPTPVAKTIHTMPVVQMPGAHVRLAHDAGKARLSVKSAHVTTECVRMKLEAGQAGALRLAAGKNHVHITGTKWKAHADRIEIGNDGQVVLTGHVKLVSDKLGVCAAVRAEKMCVQVKAGKFEKIAEQK